MEHAQGPGTTNLYPANTGMLGHRSKVREGMVWRWGEEKAYSGVLAQIILGEMFYWDYIPPKKRKDEFELLYACHEG